MPTGNQTIQPASIMKASILSIGDELLIGQTLNTNAHWMSRKLTEMGITVAHVINLSDEANDIRSTLSAEMETSEIILITGGLGPTSDDITRDVLADFFDSSLVFDDKVFSMIEKIFVHRGREINESTKDLAMVPDKATTIYNTMGTAPGALYAVDKKIIVSMPGVPYEMKAMVRQDILPFLLENLDLPVIIHRHIHTAGRGESQLSDKLKDVEAELDPSVSIAYLPGIGEVKIRLTAKGTDKALLGEKIEAVKQQVLERIGDYVYGFDGDSLEASVGRTLRELGLMIGTAESCTGGNIAKSLTSVSGSSAYFEGSIVSYSNKIKHELLGVNAGDLAEHGAVSEPVVEQMILGALRQLKTDVAIAVSGIAGPTGGSDEKPVGTVFIGIGNQEKQWVRRFLFTKNRTKNIEITTVIALVMLRKFLQDEFVQDGKKE
ncbi:MAG: competence/damage-inducible protein A [Bacteroidetes bacterium]|nr:competence/damage-inducible protein A [Bacteroidota bacterium]